MTVALEQPAACPYEAMQFETYAPRWSLVICCETTAQFALLSQATSPNRAHCSAALGALFVAEEPHPSDTAAKSTMILLTPNPPPVPPSLG